MRFCGASGGGDLRDVCGMTGRSGCSSLSRMPPWRNGAAIRLYSDVLAHLSHPAPSEVPHRGVTGVHG
jgi:hypothetical protein